MLSGLGVGSAGEFFSTWIALLRNLICFGMASTPALVLADSVYVPSSEPIGTEAGYIIDFSAPLNGASEFFAAAQLASCPNAVSVGLDRLDAQAQLHSNFGGFYSVDTTP